ncbi:MAG: hypothetical protein RIT45_3450 [Pseudomonadota bacterium]|jgi:hypothetical protein
MGRDARIVGVSTFIGLTALWLVVTLTTGRLTEWPRFADDAFYYFYVAENVWRGWGLSMDGLHTTNGFQPLWMLVCLGLFRLPLDARTTVVAAIQVIDFALVGVIAALLWQSARRVGGVRAAVMVLGLLGWPRFVNLLLGGMESAVTLLAALLAFRELSAGPSLSETGPTRRDATVGFLLAMLMLGRLDSVWIAFAIAALYAIRAMRDQTVAWWTRLRITVRKGLSVFWPVLALVVPYLLWNRTMFGAFVPISGVLKTTFPHPGVYVGPLRENVELVAMLGLGTLGLAATWRDDEAAPVSRVHAAFLVGAFVHLAYTTLFMNWAVLSGHFVTYQLVGFVGLALLVRAVERRIRPLPGLVVAGFVAMMLAGLAYSVTKGDPTFRPAAEQGAAFAVDHLPADAVFAMKDSGAFSYYSQRRVVNLDGIISSREYQEALCQGTFEAHLRAAGVTHIVQHAVPKPGYRVYRQQYPCHLPGGSGAFLDLDERTEIFRSDDYGSGGGRSRLAIWTAPWARGGR